MKKLLMLGLLAAVLVVGCQADKGTVGPSENQYTVQRVIEALDAKSPTEADSVYLANVPADLWDEVERRIGETGLTSSEPRSSTVSPDQAKGWPWDGSTRADIALCEQNGYSFQGHHAVYFTVDGPANCYNKDLDWWVAQCTVTHGCVSGWSLLLSGGWYWRDGKWVKNVALIVPTLWWYNYWWWPNDFKARRFLLYWNDVSNGYCE